VADPSALRALPGEGKVVALDRMVLASAEQWLAGGAGLTVHTLVERWIAPALAVVLLVVAFVDRRIRGSIAVVGAVVLLWLTGLTGSVPVVAAVHEAAGYAVFGTALWAAGPPRRPDGPVATRVYLVLAGLVVVGLVVQAMALGAVVSGIAGYVSGSHAEVYDSMLSRPEEWAGAGIGYPVHVLAGIFGLPLLALILLVAAPVTARRAGVVRAAVVLVAVLARGALTILGEHSPWAAAGFQLAGFAVLAAALWAGQLSLPAGAVFPERPEPLQVKPVQ
jgi:hypothetical protein